MKRFIRLSCCLSLGAFASQVSASPVIIADFESGTIGQNVSTIGWTQATSGNLTFTIQEDPADATNKVLRAANNITAGQDAVAHIDLPTAIAGSSTAATLFFRMRFDGNAAVERSFAGLAPDGIFTTGLEFDNLATYAGGSNPNMLARNGGANASIVSPAVNDTWYNVWFVLNNDANTYNIYVNTGTDGATAGDLVGNNFGFRFATGALGTLAIVVAGNQENNAAVYFDDFIYDTSGENLNFALIPEPSFYAMGAAFLAFGAVLLRRRRKTA